LVVNDSRVRPARLHLHKPTGGSVEVLLLDEDAERPGRWEALVRPNRRVRAGVVLRGPGDVAVEVGDDLGDGLRRVTVAGDVAAAGEMPLPPYIHEPLDDQERYQTVYARRAVSAAAPTAGLHFTAALVERCRAAGAVVAPLELAVGLGTFRPLTSATVAEHAMHAEAYCIPASTVDACASAARVLAVGTTVVRALEAAAATGTLEGRTDLFIQRGFDFQVVDALLTNFHVPRTTLLALIDAFIGPRWRDLYAIALAEGYRFLSFGDAMLVERAGR
jgi:S-adenosylmethionine:tRNA ribosyltransferase-isomerase